MQIELAALEYAAGEEFFSLTELEEFVRLHDGDEAQAQRLLAEWRHRGWIEEIEQADGLPALLRLADRAFRDQPWLPQPPN